jgi:hypothetical protein
MARFFLWAAIWTQSIQVKSRCNPQTLAAKYIMAAAGKHDIRIAVNGDDATQVFCCAGSGRGRASRGIQVTPPDGRARKSEKPRDPGTPRRPPGVRRRTGRTQPSFPPIPEPSLHPIPFPRHPLPTPSRASPSPAPPHSDFVRCDPTIFLSF